MESNSEAKLISKSEIYDKIRDIGSNEKISFIFGAGASYGYLSDGTVHSSPPIVAKLFETENRVVNSIIHKPQHSSVLAFKSFLDDYFSDGDGDLEKHLSDLYNQDKDDDILSALVAYLQDIFLLASKNFRSTANNYVNLVQLMSSLRSKDKWSFITFNYDTLLEQSLVFTGRNRTRTFSNFRDYIEVHPKLIKVHGGFNFRFQFNEIGTNYPKSYREVFHLMMTKKTDEIPVLDLANDIPEFYSRGQQWNSQKGSYDPMNLYDFPLMMIPIHGTNKPENPFFLDTLKKTKEEISDSGLIIAIGYNFGDKLFCKYVKELDLSKKSLILVGTNSLVENRTSHQSIQNLEDIWPMDRISIFDGNGFTDFIKAIMTKRHNLIRETSNA